MYMVIKQMLLLILKTRPLHKEVSYAFIDVDIYSITLPATMQVGQLWLVSSKRDLHVGCQYI